MQYGLTGQKDQFLSGVAPEMDATEFFMFLLEQITSPASPSRLCSLKMMQEKRCPHCGLSDGQRTKTLDQEVLLRVSVFSEDVREAPTFIRNGHPDVQQCLNATLGGSSTDQFCTA